MNEEFNAATNKAYFLGLVKSGFIRSAKKDEGPIKLFSGRRLFKTKKTGV